MKIDRDEVKRIAALAHLSLDDEAVVRMAGEMTKILSYIDQLREVDVSVSLASPASSATELREDIARPTVDRASVAANAPDFNADGHFVVPQVIGD